MGDGRCECALDLLALRPGGSEAEAVTMTRQIASPGKTLTAVVTGECFYLSASLGHGALVLRNLRLIVLLVVVVSVVVATGGGRIRIGDHGKGLH